MKILIVHNRYLQPGGEDVVVDAEAALLAEHGHEVTRLETSNESLVRMHPLRAASQAVWNGGARADVSDRVAAEQPDVVHFHNTFPLLSPAVLHLRGKRRPRVVQTLHNYRLVCPAATLIRGGVACEKCVGRSGLSGVWHACYRDSRAATATVALAHWVHGALGTWTRQVDAFIALSPFARDVFVRGGIPAEKLHLKTNFLSRDPGRGAHDSDAFLFVGRLSDEKGVRVLLDAWAQLSAPAPLQIMGDGPLRPLVEAAARTNPAIAYLGSRDHDEVLRAMKRARALVVPSLAQENSPLALLEAFATGTPVIASDLQNLRMLTEDGAAGALFRAADAAALAAAVRQLAADPARQTAAGASGRRLYERNYTADVNYRQLMRIYTAGITEEALLAV